ncbi:MAG: hypothetical protein ACXWFE_12330 [Solirubrobacterales bacterium]
MNASAVIEPDADRDGFGDETQYRCSTSAATQGRCPAKASKKKCKKKGKGKKTASSAKKKCKKKKKKK